MGVVSVILFGILTFLPYNAVNNPETSLLVSSISSQIPETTTNASQFLNQTDKFRAESPDFLLVQESSLKSALPPGLITPQVLGALVEGSEPEDIGRIIVEYIVEPGDSLWSIAGQFNVSLNTILWANNLNQNTVLKLGQKLIIPPVSGVIHYVKAGETISVIAQKYKAKTDEVLAFNDLSFDSDVYAGDVVIVPGGVMPAPTVKYVPPPLAPLASSYFICPISGGCRMTQGLHFYNAVDFSNRQCGEPILAAAGGTVLKVRLTNSTSRWAFNGYGNHLTIEHPNGVVTYYGHLLSAFVSPGQVVSQGQIIALMGGQPRTPGAGNSTACHLHFGVSGARNPFAK
ncbi:MAG: LysM peptidoglycan-binding domain-containing protein [bacterium]|nr:LysM peptidoglycan-binding domain-containing protein [bacterium]